MDFLSKTLLLSLVIFNFSSSVNAAALEDYDLVVVSPADERAVLRDKNGSLTVVKTGDVIPGTTSKIQQILSDRVLLLGSQPEPLNGTWLYRAQGTEHSRIEKMGGTSTENLSQTPLIFAVPDTPSQAKKAQVSKSTKPKAEKSKLLPKKTSHN